MENQSCIISGSAIRAPNFLAGGGEMGALMRATDWARTPIGPIESWSPTLRMMVSFLLANRFPLLLWWGPNYVSIYNDAYRPILGAKHPRAMGQPVRECWSEIWHVLKPLIDTPFSGGPATWMEDLALEINRHGFIEETHFTVAYSPVPDERTPRGIRPHRYGQPPGLFLSRVISPKNAERLKTLYQLSNPSRLTSYNWRGHRPAWGHRSGADIGEIDFGHRQIELPQHRIGKFVVALEAAAQPPAPGRDAAAGM
jgi:hypothetical protein